MPRKQLERIMQFDGGLNTKVDATMLAANFSPDLDNCLIRNGAIEKRPGCIKYNTNAVNGSPFYSIHRFYKSDGSAQTVGTCGPKLVSIPEGNTVPTVITSAFTDAAHISYQTYIDYLYVMNEQDGLFRYDGSTLSTAIAGAPAAKWVIAHSERMWAANVTAHRSEIYWSAAFDPTSWMVTDDFWQVAPDDGDEITGLAVLYDNLIVFKTNSIWAFVNTYDPDNEMQLVKKVSDIGCIAGRTIQVANNRIYFLSKNGVYEFDGVAARIISDNVDSDIRGISPTLIENACAGINDNRYYMVYAEEGQTKNNKALIYDIVSRNWTRSSGKYAESNQLISLNGGSDSNELLSATSNATGYVYKLNQGDDDDTEAIDFYYYTPWMSMQVPESKKKLKKFWVYAQALGDYALNVTYFFDLAETGSTTSISLSGSPSKWGNMVWDLDVWGGLTMMGDRQQAQGKGRYVQFKFANSNANESIKVYGLSMLYRPKRPR